LSDDKGNSSDDKGNSADDKAISPDDKADLPDDKGSAAVSFIVRRAYNAGSPAYKRSAPALKAVASRKKENSFSFLLATDY
jgi:hypothetical protein